jgi:hypothetical protein
VANRKKVKQLTREMVECRCRMGQVLLSEKEVKALLGRVPRDLTNCCLCDRSKSGRKLFRTLEVMNHVKGKEGEFVRSNGVSTRRVLPGEPDDSREDAGAGSEPAVLVNRKQRTRTGKVQKRPSSRSKRVPVGKRRVATHRQGRAREQLQSGV